MNQIEGGEMTEMIKYAPLPQHTDACQIFAQLDRIEASLESRMCSKNICCENCETTFEIYGQGNCPNCNQKYRWTEDYVIVLSEEQKYVLSKMFRNGYEK